MRGTATFQIHGRIASDPDLITLQNGQVRCVAPVVVNVPWKDKHDEWQEETVWFRMAWFGQAAKRVADRIEKGVPVLITGDIRSYQVEQEDGKKITNYNFRPRFLSVIDEAQRLEKRRQKDGNTAGGGSAPNRSSAPAEPSTDLPDGDPFSDDDIPF